MMNKKTNVKISELINQFLQFWHSNEINCNENINIVPTPLPGVMLFKYSHITTCECYLYEPIACLILQGRKEITCGNNTYNFGSGELLIVSHDLPVASQVTEASIDFPFLAIMFKLDMETLRSLYDQVDESMFKKQDVNSMVVNDLDEVFIDTMGRYLTLLSKSKEIKVMAPLIHKELHFRLLMASKGGMLRQLLWHDSHASRISRSIAMIRKNFKEIQAVSDLANAVGMSPSSFHQHFKAITATSPIQYQKDLRLLEAKRLLTLGAYSVSNVAFEVGYESSTQFSREYSRKFGVSPKKDNAKVSI